MLDSDKNFDFDNYSKSVKDKFKDKILKELYLSYIESNESIDKFSNWCLAISGSMIPIIFLNIDKISPYYSQLDLKFLIYILVTSSFFGLLSKYISFKINAIKPAIILINKGIQEILNEIKDEIDIVEKRVEK